MKQLDWLFESGATAVWLSTTAYTRAERFYKAANWEYAGWQPNGEVRFEMRRGCQRAPPLSKPYL